MTPNFTAHIPFPQPKSAPFMWLGKGGKSALFIKSHFWHQLTFSEGISQGEPTPRWVYMPQSLQPLKVNWCQKRDFIRKDISLLILTCHLLGDKTCVTYISYKKVTCVIQFWNLEVSKIIQLCWFIFHKNNPSFRPVFQ